MTAHAAPAVDHASAPRAEGIVVHTIPGLKSLAGGVARSVPSLCEALARQGLRSALLTQRPAGFPAERLLLPDQALLDVRLLPGFDLERWRVSYTPGVQRALGELCSGGGGMVHDHGLWLHMNHAVAAAANRLRVPRVVSPRGMLQDWSMRYRGWKKRVAWLAYQRRDLTAATAFSATSRDEAGAIRAAGFSQPVAVIPNGVDCPPDPAWAARDASPRTVLFMSRLHPKKGILDLVDAWAALRPPGWRLAIAGPDEGGYRRVVEDAVRRSGCGNTIAMPGVLEHGAKDRALRSASLFVLPSYSENFGIVVAEALAYGIPTITTRATPWQQLEERRCGWWVETGAEALLAALREATACGEETLRQMGRRGRELAAAEFSWATAAARHIEFYRWVLGRGERPSFVLDQGVGV